MLLFVEDAERRDRLSGALSAAGASVCVVPDEGQLFDQSRVRRSVAAVVDRLSDGSVSPLTERMPVLMLSQPHDQASRSAFSPNLLVLPCAADADRILQLLALMLDRQKLVQENREICDELSKLNAGLHRMVEDKVHEIATLKDQLSAMFVAVPDVLSAGTIEAKLLRAADALTAPNFFEQCLILYEDPESGWQAVSKGDQQVPADIKTEFDQLVQQLGEQHSAIVLPSRPGDAVRTLLVPLKDEDGHARGICRLTAADATFPSQRESLHLVELFLDEVMQSVEHFRLERHLEQSEASYRLLIDNVSDVIFRVDAEGRFTFVSRRVQEILGLTWKQILGRPFWEFVHPEQVESAQSRFEVLLQGNSATQDLRLIRSDGREVIVYVSADPVYERGVVTGALGVARDVTERRTLEIQIAESERKYRRLTENAYDAIFLVDADTYQILDVNTRAEELTGYSREELLSLPMYRLRHSDQWDALRERMQQVMQTGVGRYEDAPLLRKDGTAINVETAASTVELEGRRYYHAIVRDISEHKRMTAELNQRVMELQILAEVSDALQSAVDLENVMGIVLAGVTAGNGLGFNRAFILSYDKERQELRGEAGVGPGSAEEAGRIWSELADKRLSLQEILERRAHSVWHEKDAAATLSKQLSIPLNQDYVLFLSAIQKRDALLVTPEHGGNLLPHSFYEQYQANAFAVIPLVTQDDVIGLMLVDNLVTGARIAERDLHRLKLFANAAASAIERSRLLQSLEKRLHELTLANKELKESRNRLVKTERLTAIGEVAASVAHEIRNPLAAIGGFARSVFQTLAEEDRNKSKVKVIVEETDRLEQILSGLLEFSRPSMPRFTDMDMNSLILQTIHFMDAEIDDDLIKVTYDLDPELPRVWADAQQLRQVLLNILRNGIQAMARGGVLVIKTEQANGEVSISVHDSGPGIPPEQLSRIFDAFYTTKPTGSGLGLAISAQIIRNHNGRITAVPTDGKGAKFVIYLPIAQKSA